jgi:hypothetical protein
LADTAAQTSFVRLSLGKSPTHFLDKQELDAVDDVVEAEHLGLASSHARAANQNNKEPHRLKIARDDCRSGQSRPRPSPGRTATCAAFTRNQGVVGGLSEQLPDYVCLRYFGE